MAPTNRLIEARRAQLRAEHEADKRGEAKAAPNPESRKPQATPPKARSKAKA